MKKIILHTDGGSRGNPGPAGSGAIMFDEQGTVLGEVKKYLGHTTNNVAEYEAVRIGLAMMRDHFGADECKNLDVVVRMDSELVCKQLNGQYRVKNAKLIPLFTAVRAAYTNTFPHISFEHVRREKNKDADRLANEAMDQASRQ
jgi:ribonuclease HI